MELICISCWQPFEHDIVPEEENVTCPHCGFAQPGPDPSELEATLEANTRPTQVSSKAEAAPQPIVTPAGEASEAVTTSTEPDLAPDETSPEITLPIQPETDEEPAVKANQTERAEEQVKPTEDVRWRLMTPEGLLLYFPEHEALQVYLTGDEGNDYAVACGEGPLRPLTGFLGALQLTEDPLAALANVSPLDGQPTEAASTPRPKPRKRPPTAPENARTKPTTKPEAKAAQTRPATSEVDVKAAKPVRARSRRRRATATSDFTFRTSQEKPVWPGRILFLVIGLLTGSLAIYYLAWVGLLPGIVY